MPKDQNATARAKSPTQIGAHDWRRSGYDTFSYDSPCFRQWISAQLGPQPADILSVGCGSGELEHHLIGLGHSVVGLDLSLPMLKRAARNGLDLLVQADARFLPFAVKRFDRVMIMEAIGYLMPDEVFAQARRVLRKSGRLLITTYGARVEVQARYRKWRMEELASQLGDAGFSVDEQRYLDVKRKSLRDAPSEERSSLLYLSATVNK